MAQNKRKMTHEAWQIMQYISLAIAAIMELYEIANHSKKFHFWWKTIMILFIALGAFCAISDTHKMAEETKIQKINDSIKYAKDCEKSENELRDYFERQKTEIPEIVSAQMKDEWIKIHKTVKDWTTTNHDKKELKKEVFNYTETLKEILNKYDVEQSKSICFWMNRSLKHPNVGSKIYQDSLGVDWLNINKKYT